MEPKKVAIILLNWNNSNDTIECIKSLMDSDLQIFRIIVIDNASEVHDLRKLEVFTQKHSNIIELKKNKSNFGFSHAHNIVFNSYIKKEEFIWVLNNDTIILKNSLSALISYFNRNPDVAIVGSIMTYYNSPNVIQSYGGGRYYPSLGLSKLLYKDRTLEDVNSMKKTKTPDYLMGSSLLVRSECLNRLNGFDDAFFVYGEDLDFSLRAKREKIKLAVCPESIILHKDSGSTKGKKDLFYYLLFKSNMINTKKHYPYFLPTAALFNLGFLLITIHNFKNLKSGIKGLIDGIIK